MDHQAIAKLSGTALEYAFARAMGFQIIGTEQGPFALHSSEDATLHAFGGDGQVVRSSFMTDLAEIPLEQGKELGAALYIENGVAKCDLKGLSAEGNSYMQALLRALVMYLSSKQDQIAKDNK